jgi:hypothetical protein
VTEIELAPLIAKLRQMVAHARTHGCFDGGVRDEITEAADKLEALSGRVSTAREALLDIRNRVLCPVGPSPTIDELQEIASAALAQTQSEG